MPSGYQYSWTGKVSSAFGLAANWYNTTIGATATVAPGISDLAVVVASGSIDGPGEVFELGLTGTASGLSVGGALYGSYVFVGGTVALAGGAELSSSNLIDIGDGSSETIAQRIPTLLTVGAGATLYAYSSQADGLDILIGQQGGNGTLAVTGAGAIASAGNDGVWVGDAGTGVLTVAAGGILEGGGNTGSEPGSLGLAIGTGAGSGVVSVTGAGSEIYFGDIVDVGYGGAGALAVSSGATFAAGDEQTSLILGDTVSTASGVVAITGAAATFYGVIEDGAFGQGDLAIGGDASVTATSNAVSGTADQWSVLIGADAGGIGTLSVTGGSLLTTLHGIAVGSAATGTLIVSSATVAINQVQGTGLSALALGLGAGTTGIAEVTAGYVYDEKYAGMIIGAYGSGTLDIAASSGAGGTVVTGTAGGIALTVGSAAGSSGDISLTGAGSALYIFGAVLDGAAGTGSISVGSGGTLTAGGSGSLTGLAIGSDGGAGVLAISGGGVSISGQTDVGDLSGGAITVAAGGSFSDIASGIAAVVLGVEAGVTGTMLLTDSGTSGDLAAGLTVGNAGTGDFTLENGARFYVGTSAGEASPSVIVAASAGSAGTLTIESGANFGAATGVAVGSEGNGLIAVADATLNIATPSGPNLSALSAGLAAGVTGTLDISGGLVDDKDLAGVVLGANGTGILAITEASGQGGTLLTGGASGLALGVVSGASGIASVNGAGSLLDVNGTISDGIGGTGTLTVTTAAKLEAGSAATATALALGGTGGSGALTLSAATATLLGQADVGEYGTGTLSITGGSTLAAQASGLEALVVGYGSASSGRVLISDAGTSVQLTGGLEVGDFGNASVTIQNGARVTASAPSASLPSVLIASGSGAGVLTLTGAGTALSATGEVQVGGTLTAGAATLLVSAGATFSVATAQGQTIAGATIGGAAGAPTATATVTGAGSHWTVAGGLAVGGGGGAAVLDVTSGGDVTAGTLLIDTIAHATQGAALVTGAGSKLGLATLDLGSSSSTGSLAIDAHGFVSVSGTASLYGQVSLSEGTLSAVSTLTVFAGTSVTGNGVLDGATIVDLGQIGVTSGTLTCVAPITGSGTLAIGGAGTLYLDRSEAKTVGVTFGAGGGTLSAYASGNVMGIIESWSAGDAILLRSQDVTSDSYANGTLTLLGSKSQTLGTLAFGGTLAAHNFTLSHPTGSETLISFHS